VRLAFCAHALERYVERSGCDLRNILQLIDAEAVQGLAQVLGHLVTHEGDDVFLTSPHGVWAGGLDQSSVEPDWRLIPRDPNTGLSLFSVRTFLAEDQMRPTLWYKRYKDNPSLVQA
jgi:hypothetical protein